MLYDGSFPYWREMALAVAIAIGGIVGTAAAVDTGDISRFVGTALFLAITVPLYVWKFYLTAKR
jgi:hypothetical protein